MHAINKKSLLLSCTFFCLAYPQALFAAEKKSTWEAGFGIGALNVPHYLGSKKYDLYAAPLPYIRYKGEVLKADRKGVRGVLWQSDKVEFSLSTKASLPVDSDDNELRSGMADLDPIFEIGPSLSYELYTSENNAHSVSFEFPIRSAFSFDGLKISHQGWNLNPKIDYYYANKNWKLNVNLGPTWANQSYHDYFYGVSNQQATILRPAFSAKKGYTATRFSSSVSYRISDWYIGAFINYYNLQSAANLDSPLVETNNNFMAGFFVANIFRSNDSN